MRDLMWEKRESSRRGSRDRRVSWIVHGDGASVEFWIQVIAEAGEDWPPGWLKEFRGEPCTPGGFEIHRRSGEGPTSHENCKVLGGPCWHDGSSLAASEFFETWNQGDEQAIRECVAWLRGE